MQIQNVIKAISRITPALVSLVVHCAVIGAVLITTQIKTSSKPDKKPINVDKTFFLVSPTDYQKQPVSVKHKTPPLQQKIPHKTKKVEQPSTAAINKPESLVTSSESDFKKSNQNQMMDTTLNNADVMTTQHENIANSADPQESKKLDSAVYIDENRVNGGLKAVFKPAIPYPQAAQDREIEGDVEVEFMVSAQGTVENVVILKTTHPIFTNTVEKIVKSWRFKPVIVGGMPVRVKAVQNISFRLDY